MVYSSYYNGCCCCCCSRLERNRNGGRLSDVGDLNRGSRSGSNTRCRMVSSSDNALLFVGCPITFLAVRLPERNERGQYTRTSLIGTCMRCVVEIWLILYIARTSGKNNDREMEKMSRRDEKPLCPPRYARPAAAAAAAEVAFRGPSCAIRVYRYYNRSPRSKSRKHSFS